MTARGKIMNLMRTNLCAVPAENTQGSLEQQLRIGTDRFRIMAPGAAQRTPLEKDGRPDPRTVMGTQVLDTEDSRNFHRFTPAVRLAE